MNKYLYQIISVFCLAIFLSACSTLNPEAPLVSAKHTDNWSLQGRIAMKAGTHGGNASFVLKQAGKQYSLRLFGPLGINAIKLEETPYSAVLTESDGKTYTASSAETLLYQKTGFQLPVLNLPFWIRGLSVPGLPASYTEDTLGRLKHLQQQGWAIDYLSYLSASQQALPRLITFKRPGVLVRVVIDKAA